MKKRKAKPPPTVKGLLLQIERDRRRASDNYADVHWRIDSLEKTLKQFLEHQTKLAKMEADCIERLQKDVSGTLKILREICAILTPIIYDVRYYNSHRIVTDPRITKVFEQVLERGNGHYDG